MTESAKKKYQNFYIDKYHNKESVNTIASGKAKKKLVRKIKSDRNGMGFLVLSNA